MPPYSPSPAAPPRRSHYAGQLLLVSVLTWAAVVSLSASDVVAAGWGPKLYLLGRMALLVALCSFFLWRGGENWAALGLRTPRPFWRVPVLVVLGLVLVIGVSLLVHRGILPLVGVEQPVTPKTSTGTENPLDYFYWAFLVSWGSAAVGEELLARGFILDRIAKIIGAEKRAAPLVAIVGQAALFGSFHLYQGLGGALLTGLTGVVLGLLWLWGGRNLWPCILLHGLVNFIAANGL